LFSAVRGAAFGAGLYRIVGLGFAVAFATITFGQLLAYSRGMRPATDYAAFRRRLSRRQFWGTVIRTIGYIATALICSTFIHHVEPTWLCHRRGLGHGHRGRRHRQSYIEYHADNLPERRLGIFGIGLILCSFALQSVQYWLALFDVPVT
jgi:hypothetical protein